MAIALVAHTAKAAGTSPAIDTTGADWIGLFTSNFNASELTSTVSDSKSNAWNRVLYGTNGGAAHNVIAFWVADARTLAVGAAHTFTVTSFFGSLAVAAFSGVTRDAFSAGTASAESLAPGGSLTTIRSGGLALAGIGWTNARTMAIDDGFSITDQVDWSSGVNMGVALAYRILTDAAIAPTWSWTGATSASAGALIVDGGAVAGAAVPLGWMGHFPTGIRVGGR